MFRPLSEEVEMVRDLAREIVGREIAPYAAAWDEREEFPAAALKVLGEQGLFGVFVPEAYGGTGLGSLATLVIIEEIAKACGATATSYGAQPLGCYPILLAGSEEQKQRYLPRAASGAWLAAFALTEPEAGSDPGSARTLAVRQGDDYLVNGVKTWITSGHVADFIILYAKTDANAGSRGLTAFVLEKGMPGFTVGKHERKMGIRASATVELILEDVRIPVANRIGEEGEGFSIAMRTLDRGRPTVAAIALGIAEGALAYATQYCRERRQFNQPIGQFQAVQFLLADMAMKVHAARLMVYDVGRMIDANVKHYTRESAMAKVFASDMAMEVTTDAVQLLGGYGYSREYPVERAMRDAKVTQIYEGTNQIQRLVIARELLGRLT